jgi:hypothetical protein
MYRCSKCWVSRWARELVVVVVTRLLSFFRQRLNLVFVHYHDGFLVYQTQALIHLVPSKRQTPLLNTFDLCLFIYHLWPPVSWILIDLLFECCLYVCMSYARHLHIICTSFACRLHVVCMPFTQFMCSNDLCIGICGTDYLSLQYYQRPQILGFTSFMPSQRKERIGHIVDAQYATLLG